MHEVLFQLGHGALERADAALVAVDLGLDLCEVSAGEAHFSSATLLMSDGGKWAESQSVRYFLDSRNVL